MDVNSVLTSLEVAGKQKMVEKDVLTDMRKRHQQISRRGAQVFQENGIVSLQVIIRCNEEAYGI